MTQIARTSTVGQLTGTPGYGGGRNPIHASVPKHNVTPAVSPQNSILSLVNAILAAQEKPLRMEEAQRQKQSAVTQQQMQNATSGIIAALQQSAATGGRAYDEATQATDQLGRQAASYFQGQNPNQADQSVLKAIGAPVAQQQAVGAQNASLFSGGPGYVLGAQIPGASLQAQKAAQVSYLAGLPAVGASQGAAAQAAFRTQDQAAHQTYLTNLQRIIAQTPQLVNQAQAQAQAQYVAAQRAQVAAAGQLANAQYLLKKEGFTQQQINLATTKEQHAYDLAQQNLTVAQNRANTYQQSVDQTGAYQTGKLTADANKPPKGTPTRPQAIKNRRKARAAAINKVLGIPTTVTGKKTVPANPATLTPASTITTKTPRQYNAIVTQAFGLPEVQALMTAYGFSRAQVRVMIQAALKSKGIVPKKKAIKNPKSSLGF